MYNLGIIANNFLQLSYFPVKFCLLSWTLTLNQCDSNVTVTVSRCVLISLLPINIRHYVKHSGFEKIFWNLKKLQPYYLNYNISYFRIKGCFYSIQIYLQNVTGKKDFCHIKLMTENICLTFLFHSRWPVPRAVFPCFLQLPLFSLLSPLEKVM